MSPSCNLSTLARTCRKLLKTTNQITKHVSSANRNLSLTSHDHGRILITGSLGQLGVGVARMLRERNGSDNVIMSDVRFSPEEYKKEGPFMFADILDFKHLQRVVVDHDIDTVVHFSAILSALGELNVKKALDINIYGFHNVIELCRKYDLKLFSPSTIGAFGEDSPRNPTPDLTIQRPRTIYGVSKVHMELMGEYYNKRFGLDFRSARFPGVISADTEPGGGTTDYAVEIFHSALRTGEFTCILRGDTRLPMIYFDDVIRGTVELLYAPQEDLSIRTYNLAAMSFTPEEIADEIQKHIPNFRMKYTDTPDSIRQPIADGWPQVLDDSNARADWKWREQFNLAQMVEEMFRLLKPKYMKSE